MSNIEGTIISAERVGRRLVVIGLSDGTDILLTLDQLLTLSGPRFTVTQDDAEPDGIDAVTTRSKYLLSNYLRDRTARK